jgi:hypothetical protein
MIHAIVRFLPAVRAGLFMLESGCCDEAVTSVSTAGAIKPTQSLARELSQNKAECSLTCNVEFGLLI